ncbi:hypothetical protein MUG84_03630 [Paenibacillus sp. KQZ6P-2]|uniref:Uncharacterized protein n=1 Tax=Paenibacillus mangrovi TaxID=2931978 RepID=A0A9X1WPG1_9BACL|nr:hypothetical protein [Paenibacillus mangrovi]MCJ8010835.1 hypothetical protein [Paenibacillus mangrovi]
MNQSSNNGPRTQTIGPGLNKKPVFIIAVVIIIVAVLIIILSSGSKGDKKASEVIRKFQNAIAAENTHELKKLLSIDDKAMEVTEDRLRRLIQYAKEKPKYYEQTLQILIAQQALLEEAEYLNTGLLDRLSPDEVLNAGELYLKKESGFLSDTFKIGVHPQYMNITLENDNGIITVDGVEISKVSKDNHSTKVGPLFPGEYQVEFTTTFDYAKKDISQSETVSLFGLESETEYSDYVTGQSVKINSDLGEVQVYLNDQPTPFIQRSNREESSEYFYPAFDDGSQKIQGVAKFPWGESKSEALVIEDLSKVYNITPELQQETKQEVLDFVQLFIKTRAKAYGTKDVSELEKLYPHHEGDLLEDVQDGLGRLYYSGGSDKTLKEVELKKMSFSAEDPLEHVGVYYDRELKQYIVQVKNIKANYTLILSNGDIDDILNFEVITLDLIYSDGKWTVLRNY